MGAWYWIGVLAGIGAALGVLAVGILVRWPLAAVIGGVLGAAIGVAVFHWPEAVAGAIGGVLGEMLARLGRLDEAEAILDDAIALSTPDDWVTVEAVMMGRAFVASGRGDHDLACELAREAMELVDSLEYVTLQQDARMSRADILLAAGRRDEARTALAWAREAAARKGSTVLVERADRLTAGLDA